MVEKDYQKFVTDYFNIILDISDMENNRFKFNLFHYLREYFALANPRAVVYDTETRSSILAFKLEHERLPDLIVLISDSSIKWKLTEQNGRYIFVFE